METTLLDIALRWITTGELSADNGTLLKAQYLQDISAPVGCKVCGSVWSDIKHHFSYKLKLLNLLPVATKLRKYIILGSGFLMLPGSSTVIVNDGEESEDRKILTDEMAEGILAEYPSYKELIAISPAWAAVNEQTESEEDSQDQTSDEDNESTALESAKSALADLQAKYDELTKDNRVLKGQLTRATNEIAKLKEASTTVANPVVAPSIVAAEPSVPTDAATTGEAKGNPAADSTASVVEGA